MLDKMNDSIVFVQMNGEFLENGIDYNMKINLIINYLLFLMSEGEFKNLFGEFGIVLSCKFVWDRVFGNSFGYVFVNYEEFDQVVKVVRELNWL